MTQKYTQLELDLGLNDDAPSIVWPPFVSEDMYVMHSHYGIHEAMKKLTKEQLLEFVNFRFRFLQEEVDEGFKAIEDKSPEEIIDSLIDIIVIAVGSIDLFGADFTKAWNEVLRANMTKEVGIKASRPNKLGLPDLIKPAGFVNPDHTGNHGILPFVFA